MKAVYILGGIALISNLVGFAVAGKEDAVQKQPAAVIQKLDTSAENSETKLAAAKAEQKNG